MSTWSIIGYNNKLDNDADTTSDISDMQIWNLHQERHLNIESPSNATLTSTQTKYRNY